MTRWSLTISNEVDKALRLYLAQSGGKRGALSHFVEEAVKEKLFYATAAHLKARNRTEDQQAILDTVEEALDWSRATRH